MSNKLIELIKEDEGFRGINYLDSLNIPTIGFGTKLPLTEAEAELILQFRLNQKISHLLDKKPIILTLNQDRQIVLFSLAYQLGVTGLLNFKRMWSAIEDNDFATASMELLDSKYATQTPSRATKNAKILGGVTIL